MSKKEKDLSVVFVYSQDFMERVIRNLINDPSYCKSCGLYCESCKYNVYSFVRKVRAAIQLSNPADLPAFVDNPEEYAQEAARSRFMLSVGAAQGFAFGAA